MAGPSASVLEELGNIEVVSETVGRAPMGPNAAPGRIGPHHQPAAVLGQRTVRYSTTIRADGHHRHGKGMSQRQFAAAQRARDTAACSGQVTASGAGSSPAEHIAEANFLAWPALFPEPAA